MCYRRKRPGVWLTFNSPRFLKIKLRGHDLWPGQAFRSRSWDVIDYQYQVRKNTFKVGFTQCHKPTIWSDGADFWMLYDIGFITVLWMIWMQSSSRSIHSLPWRLPSQVKLQNFRFQLLGKKSAFLKAKCGACCGKVSMEFKDWFEVVCCKLHVYLVFYLSIFLSIYLYFFSLICPWWVPSHEDQTRCGLNTPMVLSICRFQTCCLGF